MVLLKKNALSRLMKGQGYIDAFHVHVYTCSIPGICNSVKTV